MISRWSFYLLNALSISCILSFGYNYRALFAAPKFSKPSGSIVSSDRVSDKRGVSITLCPEEHISREPMVIDFKWKITQGYRSPDGVQKLVYLINGAFPGPTIEARPGDILVVEVQNLLEYEGVAFHWHGLHMRGANRMDGAVGITQSHINPGFSFTYEYHSHSDIQRADGLYGGLIIHQPLTKSDRDTTRAAYEEDSLLMVGDWYHRTAHQVQASYVNHDSWGREPVPDSLLINGMGAFNCSMAVTSRPLDCTQLQSPILTLNERRSRMRVVNVGALSGLVVRVPDCHFVIFKVDGGNDIEKSPDSTAVGILYPGERIDLFLECPSATEISGSHLIVTLDAENFAIQNKALTLTHTFPISIASHQLDRRGHPYVPPKILKGEGYFDLTTAKGLPLSKDFLAKTASQNILLYTKMEILARLGNVPVGFINRTTWAAQDSPAGPLIDLDRKYWDQHQLVPWIPIPREKTEVVWVDIVVNNLDEKGHPFHLHGYDFYILSQYYPPKRGYHAYNPFDLSNGVPGGPLNLATPLKKDTIYVPSQGYVVLRIRADNLGIWFFHCHILWHSGNGMAMALEVGYENETDQESSYVLPGSAE